MVIYTFSAFEICRIFNLENVEIISMKKVKGIDNEPLVRIVYCYKEET